MMIFEHRPVQNLFVDDCSLRRLIWQYYASNMVVINGNFYTGSYHFSYVIYMN